MYNSKVFFAIRLLFCCSCVDINQCFYLQQHQPGTLFRKISKTLNFPHTSILIANKFPTICIGNTARTRIRKGLDFFCGKHVGAFDGSGKVALFLVPVDGGIFADFPIKAHIKEQVQVAAGERFQKARVRAAHLMAVEISVGLLADFHEQFLVIHGAHELDSRILVEPGLFLEFVEERFVHVGYECKVLGRLAQHELADHGLVVVLGHKTAHHKVVFLGLQALFGEPIRELFVIVGQATVTDFGPVGDERRLRVILGVAFADVFFDVLAVAYEQVGMLDHVLFGILPVLAHGQWPLGTEPLVTVGIHIELAAQLVDLLLELPRKRADSAGQAIHNRVRDLVLLDVSYALLDSQDIVGDGRRRTDFRDLHLETAGIVILELAIFFGLARHMVLEAGVVLVIFRQFVYEGFVSTVCPRNTLAANYENMLNICHKLNQMGVLPQYTGNCGVRSGKQKVTSQRHREGLVRSMHGNP